MCLVLGGLRGEVSAARMTISAMPRFSVLVASLAPLLSWLRKVRVGGECECEVGDVPELRGLLDEVEDFLRQGLAGNGPCGGGICGHGDGVGDWLWGE
jgi:hypothetical protein